MTQSDVYIIAEAGVNHNGSLDMAMQLVDVAVEAGADCVKFQTFIANSLVSAKTPLANYQQKNLEADGDAHRDCKDQLQLLEKLQLPLSAYQQLKDYCDSKSIEFMSSPFDHHSLALLVDQLNVKKLKLASGELTNGPLLLAFANSACELIVSTGMANLQDIDDALAVLAFGYLNPGKAPQSLHECRELLATDKAKNSLQQKVSLLHCTSDYPAPPHSINLKAMQTMAARWGLPVGYSDHSEGIYVSVAAVALGAKIIEKHFTLDKTLAGPDHKASLEPKELKDLVDTIRSTSISLGDGWKQPQPCELNTRDVARKSLVVATEISCGEVFTKEKLSVLRPGTGTSPMHLWDLLGKKADRHYRAGDLL